MEFCHELPGVSLVDDLGHAHMCFAADLFNERPPFEEIEAFRGWAQKLQENLLTMMARKACSVKWVGFFVDEEGVWLVARHKIGQTVNNMRQSLKTVLSGLPEEQQRSVSDSLRPLDELDKIRIGTWKTVNQLRPKTRRPVPTTLARLAEESSDSGDSDSGAEVTTLALREVQQLNVQEPLALLQIPRATQAKFAWAAKAQAYATVVMASTGPVPDLTYIRCHRENRRHLLLTRRLREGNDLFAGAVKIAAQLAKEGSLPNHGGRRTSEFMRRCVEAVKAVNPSAETDINKLPLEAQEAIRRALGNEEEPYDGCLSEECLDLETVWETVEVINASRCARCKMLKAMGRTISDPLSVIKRRMDGERGMRLRRSLADIPAPFERNVRRRTEK